MIGFIILGVVAFLIPTTVGATYLIRKKREKVKNDAADFIVYGVRVTMNKSSGVEIFNQLNYVFLNLIREFNYIYPNLPKNRVAEKLRELEHITFVNESYELDNPDGTRIKVDGNCNILERRIIVARTNENICQTALAHELMHFLIYKLWNNADSKHKISHIWEDAGNGQLGIVGKVKKACLSNCEDK